MPDGAEFMHNEHRPEIIGKLDEHPRAVLVITKEELMRGHDYRAPKKGLKLLIAVRFSHERGARQGLGRVGRQNDPFLRFRIKGVDKLVDTAKELAFTAKLK